MQNFSRAGVRTDGDGRINKKKVVIHMRGKRGDKSLQMIFGLFILLIISLVVLSLYWKGGRAKCSIGMAKGKKQHDKRATEKSRDWQREQARIVKSSGRG